MHSQHQTHLHRARATTAPDRHITRQTTAIKAASAASQNRALDSVRDSLNKAERPTAESLELLAATDPSRALALALSESEAKLQPEFLQAVLRGWASTNSEAAANWAIAQTYLEQGLAMSAVFNGAKNNPEDAVRLAEHLSKQNPEQADSFGRYLIFSLSQTDKFELGASFAAKSAPENRTDLLTAAFVYWAQHQPERAVHAALELVDPEKQDTAFQAAIDGWSRTNPQDLTKAAVNFPGGKDRTFALIKGLRSWIEQDPATAEVWITQNELSSKEAAMVLEE